MSTLICGSFAYDTIMVFPDRFKNHILPDKIHILNVSFLVPSLRREFGGCAGNIAYNLQLLGGDPLPMGTVGQDFAPYAAWMDQHAIPRRCLKHIDTSYTAQAFITTDQDDNQITAFHPGAMNHAHENHVSKVPGVVLGIVAPDGREGMLQHAREFAQADIPFIFDPGQGLPMFNGQELLGFIDQASYVTVNDYEAQLLESRTGLTTAQIAQRVKALIVTRGAEGSVIYAAGKTIMIPCARAAAITDPTGCGDAYRAGVLYGLRHDLDWDTTGRIAALMGSIKIAQHGTQNHRFSPKEFSEQFAQHFGYRCDV
ncbi:MAG: carbohydrate kinase family protein [Gammaproteobacteria bacterium]|nr:carbohydrate kinase family protein [Gammaproteobacteria bacterium]